jgi:hypothetical protein
VARAAGTSRPAAATGAFVASANSAQAPRTTGGPAGAGAAPQPTGNPLFRDAGTAGPFVGAGPRFDRRPPSLDTLIARALRESRRSGRDHAIPAALLRRIVARLRGCLPFLSNTERQVLTLRVVDEQRTPQSVRRIARDLDLSVAQVIRVERRAVQGLRAAMRATDCAGRRSSATGAAMSDGSGLGFAAPTPLGGLHVVSSRRSTLRAPGRHDHHGHRANRRTPDGGVEAPVARVPRWLDPLTPGGPGRLTLMLIVGGAFIVGVVVGERRRRS